MILPITANTDRRAHQSSRPQGLILDVGYGIQASMVQDETGKQTEITPLDIDRLDGQLCEISISHDGDFATAVALVPAKAHVDTKTIEMREGNV